jgi:hypothetical protein
MRRSKVIYDSKNQPKGVIYLYKKGNLVGCGLYLKPSFQQRPVNVDIATTNAKRTAFRVLDEKRRKLRSSTNVGIVIDLDKDSHTFEDLWKMSRVVVENNDPYIMF